MTEPVKTFNDNLIMICGEPAEGKSASLANLENPEGVLYCNCESNKKLPFAAKFQQASVTDPYQIYSMFDQAETMPTAHTIAIDSQTFLMDMFESVHVIPAADTQSAWGSYAQYFKNLMQYYVAKSTKNVIFTAHIQSMLNEQTATMEKCIPVKGQLAKKGIEAFFSCIVTAKKMTLDSLKPYTNPLLTVTPDDEIVGYKHVFQTRPTKETVGERGMRAPMGMWSVPETFIDNDCQMLLNRLKEFYV